MSASCLLGGDAVYSSHLSMEVHRVTSQKTAGISVTFVVGTCTVHVRWPDFVIYLEYSSINYDNISLDLCIDFAHLL